jgi:transposase, IS5 family
VEDALHDHGVRNVVIPGNGKPTKSPTCRRTPPGVRRTIKWRTECEGRISTLIRGQGWNRGRFDSTEGARIWVGHGALAHNQTKIAALTA